MLSFFLAAFVHFAVFGGFGGFGHAAAVVPPSHAHAHIMDSTGGPTTG